MAERDHARSSDDAAIWVDLHGDALFRYAVARLGDRAEAEDLVQETFLAALRAGERFAGRSAVRTWLVGILKHKIIDHLRRQGRERPLAALSSTCDLSDDFFERNGSWRARPHSWPDDPGKELEKREFWETFRRCLEKLPQRMHIAFLLREMDQRTTEEICKTLNVTPGNLGVLFYRGRMQLRRCLELNWFGGATDGD